MALRILSITSHHKDTDSDYGVVIDKLYNYKDIHGKHCPIISKEYYEFAIESNMKFFSFGDAMLLDKYEF